MKSLMCRLYGAGDLRLETVDMPPAGEDGILVSIMTDSVCMSDHKTLLQGAAHTRVPDDIATNPIVVGHEVCATVLEVGPMWKGKFRVGQKIGMQPCLNEPGHEMDTVGYSFTTVGGYSTVSRVPRRVLDAGCVLPYAGDDYFKCSLAEPLSCIVSAFRTSYHTAVNSHQFVPGPKADGSMLLIASCGAMGMAAIDCALHYPGNRPSRIVVTDIDENRIAHAREVFTGDMIPEGVKVDFINTAEVEDPVAKLRELNGGKGYDDILLFASVKSLVTQCSELLGMGGCLNFFSGPMDKAFGAEFNFYNIHYKGHHVVGSSGGSAEDTADAIDWIGKGYLHPEVMVTHIGGLNAAIDTCANLPKLPGGKKMLYTHKNLPLTAIEDFARLGETDAFWRNLAEICGRNRNLWNKEAEDYLLACAQEM